MTTVQGVLRSSGWRLLLPGLTLVPAGEWIRAELCASTPKALSKPSDNCSSSEFSPDCCWTLVLINSTGSRNHSLFLPPNNHAFPSPALPGHQGQKLQVHADCRLVLSSPIRLLVLLTEHLPSHPIPSVPTLLKPCGYCPLLPACHSHFLTGLLSTSFQPLHTTTEEHAEQSLVLPP